MIIDGHIHVGRWNYPYYSSLKVGIQELNHLLTECGIDGAVILPSDRKNNDQVLSQILKYGKKKYWFFPWVDPRKKDWKTFLDNNGHHIRGIKVHASLDQVQKGVTHRLYKPVLDFAYERNMIMLVHCGRAQNTASYLYVIDVAKRYPRMNFVMCHLGGDHEKLKLEAPLKVKKEKLKNVFFDISATREFWTIAKGIKTLGAEKFIFGSDYPVMHPKVSLETVRVLNLGDEDQKLVFGGNIRRLLNDF